MDAIEALLSDLVAIDSVNPDLVPGGAGEAAIADYVADWLRDRRLEVTIEATDPARPSVVGVARGSGGGRTLMLCAHLDTVGVAGMHDPFTPLVEGTRMFGRGSYDMKGGVAAAMVAGANAVERGFG